MAAHASWLFLPGLASVCPPEGRHHGCAFHSVWRELAVWGNLVIFHRSFWESTLGAGRTCPDMSYENVKLLPCSSALYFLQAHAAPPVGTVIRWLALAFLPAPRHNLLTPNTARAPLYSYVCLRSLFMLSLALSLIASRGEWYLFPRQTTPSLALCLLCSRTFVG